MRTMANQRLFERAPLMQDFVADGWSAAIPTWCCSSAICSARSTCRAIPWPSWPRCTTAGRAPPGPAGGRRAGDVRRDPHGRPPGTVFLSYASQDRAAVLTLKAALEAAGIAVFFDQHSIPPGADWERQIRTVVRDCGLFLPFVSRHAAERDEGWFLKEWGLAIERAQGMKAHVPFIQPI